MTIDERTTRALASTVALLTPAQYAEVHLRVLMELRAERAQPMTNHTHPSPRDEQTARQILHDAAYSPYTLEHHMAEALRAERERCAVETAELQRQIARLDLFHDHMFARGMLAALAVVHRADVPTLYDEIVRSTSLQQLQAACLDDGDAEWSGLDKAAIRALD